MSREVTNSEGLLGAIIMVLLIVLMSGCATQRPQKQFAVDGFTLIVMEQSAIRQQYKTMYKKDIPGLRGYCDQEARVIFCEWNEDRTAPSFEWLGHEVWHLNELGGNYHK
jgi:hypothetical protein